MGLIKELRVPSEGSFDLDDLACDATPGAKNKEWAEKRTKENIDAIRDLQYRIFTENKQSLLIVLQAPDAAGKDGLIRKVLGKMNPQGCLTHAFKRPTEIELAHDFLWRVHTCTPAKGHVAIFNRSHYEDVLVVRVHELVPEKVWRERFDQIRSFEQLLRSSGTTVIKFYLHISRAEQLKRFGERLEDPTRHWKLNPGDYSERDRWKDYRKAYEDIFKKCNTGETPWFAIPADKKWYRDFAVSEIVRETMEKMDPQLPPVQVDLAEIKKLYLAATEASNTESA